MRQSLFFAIHLILPVSSQPVDAHKELVEQLQTEDPDEAEQIMRASMIRNKEELFAGVEPPDRLRPASKTKVASVRRQLWPMEFGIDKARNVVVP